METCTSGSEGGRAQQCARPTRPECVARALSLQVDDGVGVGEPIVAAAQCLPGGVRRGGVFVAA
jgi:hypothetical protein